MDDMYKSIKAFLYDRTSSPLFGAFIISWSIINYRVILTIFSGESLSNKFEVINTLFQPIDTGSFLVSGALVHGFIYPVIATLSYIYLYPRLAKPVYKHSLKKQIELREIKQEEESNRLLTLEESRDIYREMAEVEEKFNLQQDKHRAQVSSLIAQIKGLEKTDRVDLPDKISLNDYNMKDKIDQMPAGIFNLEQLLGKGNWSQLAAGAKKNLGREFSKSVQAGEYLGVSVEGNDPQNITVYNKEIVQQAKKLSDIKEQIMKVYVRSGDVFIHKSELLVQGEHKIEVSLAVDELVGDGYLRKIAGTNKFALTTKGKKYLSDKNMLK